MSSDAFETARNEIDLLEFVRSQVTDEVVRRGSNFAISCPKAEDGDSDPSLVIMPSKNRFRCYHCGDWNGSVIDMVMGIHNCDSFEALEYLDRLYPDLQLKTAPLSGVHSAVRKFVEEETSKAENAHLLLLRSPQILDALMKTRGFSMNTIKEFKLGVLKMGDNVRLSIPQNDRMGRTLSIATRKLERDDPRPHYLAYNRIMQPDGKLLDSDNVPEGSVAIWRKRNYMYGLESCDLRKPVFLVEGHLDRVAAHELGIGNVCAIGTNTLSDEQVILLGDELPCLVLINDTDKVGRRSVLKNLEAIRGVLPDLPVFIVDVATLRDDLKDLGDVLKMKVLGETELSVTDIVSFLTVHGVQHIEQYLAEQIASSPLIYLVPEAKKIFKVATEPVGRAVLIQALSVPLGAQPDVLSQTFEGK
jgi:DNA primase